ncbi:MAG TPA: alpha/beta fold hydrolase [Herpetosiphonaceae bacterium]
MYVENPSSVAPTYNIGSAPIVEARRLLPLFRRRSQPQMMRFGDHKLVYRVAGSGPALVLVHGLSGSGSWWRRNTPVLTRHFTVYSIDLVGYGSNRALRPIRIPQAAHYIGEFIGALPPGCAHLLGHSMGGQIATHVAAEYPHRINRLVLASASGMVRADLLRMMLRLPSAGRYGRFDFMPTLAYDALRAGPLNLLLSALDLLSNDVTDSLARIVAPTLLIWGEQDKLVPVAVGEAVHHALPSSRLEIIPRAGHVPMWDQPEQFNQLVLDFLLAAGQERQEQRTTEQRTKEQSDDERAKS